MTMATVYVQKTVHIDILIHIRLIRERTALLCRYDRGVRVGPGVCIYFGSWRTGMYIWNLPSPLLKLRTLTIYIDGS